MDAEVYSFVRVRVLLCGVQQPDVQHLDGPAEGNDGSAIASQRVK